MPLPEHAEKMGDGAMCRHCGGEVGDDGYALSIKDEDSDSPLERIDEGLSSTEESTGFAEAISRHGYAGGGRIRPDDVMQRLGRGDNSVEMSEDEKNEMARSGYNDETVEERAKANRRYQANKSKFGLGGAR